MNVAPVQRELALFGLGANLGNPQRQLALAVERLRPLLTDVRVSDVYRTRPVGYAEQPDFLNLVIAGDTAEPPERLLAAALEIERELGRIRTFPNAPRTIDIDLLAAGERAVDRAGLHLPHPRLHERAFVLVPLAEVAPEWRHPVLGTTVAEMLAALPDAGGVERLGPLT